MNNMVPKIFITSFCIIILSCFYYEYGFAQNPRQMVKEGNEYFQQEKFDQALQKYQDAATYKAKSPQVRYNIADALYKKKKYEESLKEYTEILTSETADDLLKADAYYNMGNAHYRMGKLDEAVKSYKKALEINPNDEDAKYNLEFVQNKLNEMAQNQQQNQQNQQQQQQQQGQQQSGENKKEQQQNQQQGQKQQKEGEEQPQQSQQMKKQDAKELTKEEAERILKALENQEKDQLKTRKLKAKGNIRVTKDW